MTAVLAQPEFEIEVVVLFAPQHSGQRLTVHPPLIFGQRTGRNPLVEFIRIGEAAVEYILEAGEGVVAVGMRVRRSRIVVLPPPGTLHA